MAVLPDLGAAALLAGVVFLLVLGVLVVFMDVVSLRRTAVSLAALAIVGTGLFLAGEPGIALIFAALAAALIGNQAFERLTSR